MSLEREFDPATERPGRLSSTRVDADYASRGSTWFIAGILAVFVVFGALWVVGVLEPALDESGASIAADQTGSTTPASGVDRQTTTASTKAE